MLDLQYRKLWVNGKLNDIFQNIQFELPIYQEYPWNIENMPEIWIHFRHFGFYGSGRHTTVGEHTKKYDNIIAYRYTDFKDVETIEK